MNNGTFFSIDNDQESMLYNKSNNNLLAGICRWLADHFHLSRSS